MNEGGCARVVCVGEHELVVVACCKLDARQAAIAPVAGCNDGRNRLLHKSATCTVPLVTARHVRHAAVVLRFSPKRQRGARFRICSQWREKYFERIMRALHSLHIWQQVEIYDIGRGCRNGRHLYHMTRRCITMRELVVYTHTVNGGASRGRGVWGSKGVHAGLEQVRMEDHGRGNLDVSCGGVGIILIFGLCCSGCGSQHQQNEKCAGLHALFSLIPFTSIYFQGQEIHRDEHRLNRNLQRLHVQKQNSE